MTRFTAPDLSRLPPLPATALTFEEYYASYMSDLAARLTSKGIAYNVGSLETDTYAITGEAFSYRVELLAVSIDNAIKAVLLPTSYGAYLDALGATQDPPVTRNALAASPRAFAQFPQDWESDDVFKGRIQLAPEALSTCGPDGAYLYWAISVPGVLQSGVAVYGPMSSSGTIQAPFTGLGEVHIPILSNVGDGTATPALVAAVQAAVSADDKRPIADFVTVSAATLAPYSVAAILYCGNGSDPTTLVTAAYARARAAADMAHTPGGQMLDQDLYAALKVPDTNGVPIVTKVALQGWQDVNGVDPTPAAPGPAYVAPYCPPPDSGLPPVITATLTGLQLVAGGITLTLVVVDD